MNLLCMIAAWYTAVFHGQHGKEEKRRRYNWHEPAGKQTAPLHGCDGQVGEDNLAIASARQSAVARSKGTIIHAA